MRWPRTHLTPEFVGRFTGTGIQASSNSKLWDMDVTFATASGTITYGREGVRDVCSGTLTLCADGHWEESITSGSCTQGGSWVFTAISDTILEGRY